MQQGVRGGAHGNGRRGGGVRGALSRGTVAAVALVVAALHIVIECQCVHPGEGYISISRCGSRSEYNRCRPGAKCDCVGAENATGWLVGRLAGCLNAERRKRCRPSDAALITGPGTGSASGPGPRSALAEHPPTPAPSLIYWVTLRSLCSVCRSP